MQGKYITSEVWAYLGAQNTKIARRILKALDYDIAGFVQYDNTIHIEKTYSGAYIPDYLFNYIKAHESKILNIQARLEYLRGEIEEERISYGEIAELQGLAKYIKDDDTLLLEWAGVPEGAR